MKLWLAFLLNFFVMSASSADITSQLQIEQPLQEKVQKIFRIFDPEAEVILQLSYKKFEDVLPGTNLSGEDFSLTDFHVSSAKINVFSAKKNFNEQIESFVYRALNLSKNQVQITYQSKYYASEKKVDEFDKVYINKIFEDISSKISTFVILVLSILSLVGLALLFLTQKLKSIQNKNLIHDLTQAISNISFSNKSTSAVFTKDFSTKPNSSAFISSIGQSDKFHNTIDIPELGIHEFFADCYWSEKDAWAHGFWQQLSTLQKQSCLNSLAFMADYSRYFLQIDPEPNTTYLHPYYLNPTQLSFFSNTAIRQLLDKNNSYWHLLSPIRQETLNIDLKTRLQILKTQKNDNITLPVVESVKHKRNLSALFGQFHLNEEDELFILRNPQSIPKDFRNSIRSLVWLKLLPTENILKILENFDAKSLATGLVGPTAIVDDILLLLPEKKRGLVQDYRLRFEADKNTSTYEEICQMALNDYNQLDSKVQLNAA